MTGRGVDKTLRYAKDVELDRVAASIRGWRTHITLLGNGTDRGTVCEVTVGSLRVVRLAMEVPVALEVHAAGADPAELFHVGTISSPPISSGAIWEGRSIPSDALMLKHGEIGSSFALPATCELLVARLDRGRVNCIARALRGPGAPSHAPGARVHRHADAERVEIRAHLRFLSRPDVHEHALQAAAAERELYEQVASLLAESAIPAHRPPERRRAALRRALEYVRAQRHDPIALSALCAAAECSERTLRTAFQEHYGTSPSAYIKSLRLEGLRRDLLDSFPHRATVSELAARWGFWHMGHLGRDYRRLFGEAPSATLTRPRVQGRRALGR